MSVLRIEMGVAWLLMVAAIVLGELDVIPNGLVMPHSTDEFQLNTVAILLTVVGIPVALKLFTLNTTKGLRRMNNEEALKSYHVWMLCGWVSYAWERCSPLQSIILPRV